MAGLVTNDHYPSFFATTKNALTWWSALINHSPSSVVEKSINLWGAVALKAKDSVLLIEDDPYLLFGSLAQIKGIRKTAMFFFPLFLNIMFVFFFSSILITHPEVKGLLDSSVWSAWNFSVSGILLEFYTGGAAQANTPFSLPVSQIFIWGKKV